MHVLELYNNLKILYIFSSRCEYILDYLGLIGLKSFLWTTDIKIRPQIL